MDKRGAAIHAVADELENANPIPDLDIATIQPQPKQQTRYKNIISTPGEIIPEDKDSHGQTSTQMSQLQSTKVKAKVLKW
jgi:hypothetical protein